MYCKKKSGIVNTSAVPVLGKAFRLLEFSIAAHPFNFILNIILPWVITPTKCEVALINTSQDMQRTVIHTQTDRDPFLYSWKLNSKLASYCTMQNKKRVGTSARRFCVYT